MKRIMPVVTPVLIVGGCGGGGEEAHVTAREFANCASPTSRSSHGRGTRTISTSSLRMPATAASTWTSVRTLRTSRSSGQTATRTEQAYKTFGKAFEADLSDLLHRRGNVVWLYDKSPTESEASAVEACID